MSKTSINITPVILCGGSGTRLWSLLHTGFLKQFLVLSGTNKTNSLFQQATSRLSQLYAADIVVGETHSLNNIGSVPLEIIEVQSGVYLGEDDIIRFDDCYERKRVN
jgi:mannose-1-phosphate guanylyltransferase